MSVCPWFHQQLLIGGATTSKTHTVVKIEQNYRGPTIHVTDATRGVGVIQNLLIEKKRDQFLKDIRSEYASIRDSHEKRKARRRILPLEEARRRKPVTRQAWEGYIPPRPVLTGTKIFDNYPLAELVTCIDWKPFFAAWELSPGSRKHGKYPALLDDPKIGTQARILLKDANRLLKRIVDGNLLRARAVIGLFPANSVGDDVEIYTDDRRKGILTVVHGLRQQFEKAPGRANLCLSDFVAPKETEVPDYMGAFAVTTGLGAEKLSAGFEEDHDDYNAIMTKALADRLAEAFAERMHQQVRRQFWGYAADEDLDNERLIREEYVGIRPAPGYPACPDHTEKQILFELLDAEKNTGITMTESYAMVPAASVSGWYFSHPESVYFGLGKIGRDQIVDYAGRKGMDIKVMERWLSPNLGYEPDL